MSEVNTSVNEEVERTLPLSETKNSIEAPAPKRKTVLDIYSVISFNIFKHKVINNHAL